ncbi:mucin-2-like [Macrobrachium nipponense]|uniref:mucin-2-like n=1 Tax=Macrobrachium nipponense TaxID=159736 RepID=UPI0030C7AA9D
MMISPILVVQATLVLASAVEGYNLFSNPSVIYPLTYYSAESGVRQIFPRNEDAILPCPGEAFFVHPMNCSRFYRCVDYTGNGALFSRYFFECPPGHVFFTAVQTCLPGFCPSSPQPVVPPATPAPTTPSVSPTGTGSSAFPVEPVTGSPFPITSKPVLVTTTSAPETSAPVFPITSVTPATVFPITSGPQAPVFPVTPSTAAPPVTTLGPSSVVVPSDEGCVDRYVQHPDFCNVYTPCDDPTVRYVCPGGTAFDQARQMCRISAFDDGLCTGKEVFEHAFLLRSENIGSHVRLPDYIHVPTSRPYQGTLTGVQVVPVGHPSVAKPSFQTASPLQLYLWPTSKPQGTASQFSLPNFGIEQNVHRPLFSRPAQVYRRPDEDDSSSVETYSSNFNVLRPVGVEAAPPASTKLRPLSQARRPSGHLHFPYVPAHLFGFQREVV